MTHDARPTHASPPTPPGSRRPPICSGAGGLVAFPTETVYGLGADARSAEAVAGIYAAKGRPKLQSADRPRGGPRRRAGAGALRCRRPGAGPRLLARPADPGGARDAGLHGIGPRPRRPRQRGVARARPSCRPCPDRRGRAAGRGALGQPLGPHQPDDGGPCLGGSRWTDRCRAGRRADGGRGRIGHRVLPRRARPCCGRAG